MKVKSLSSLAVLIAMSVSCAAPDTSRPARDAFDALNSLDFEVNGFAVKSLQGDSSVRCADTLESSGELEIVGEAGPQLRFSRDPVTSRNIAFIRAVFNDTPESGLAEFPSATELEALFLAPDSRIQRYFSDLSYGQFSLSGEFVADIVLDAPAARDGVQTEYSELGDFDISIPNFSETEYDQIVLVMMSDFGRGRSESGQIYSADGFSFTVNGEQLTQLCAVIAQFGHVGHSYRDTGSPLKNDFEDLTASVLLPESEAEELEVTVPLTYVERTFIHEMIHALGIQTHAYSSTNGGSLHNDPVVDGNQDFLWRDYGNRYDIMGTNDYSHGLNAGYRELLGWISDDRTVRIDEVSQRVPVVLQPLNAAEGNVLAEVRLPGKYFLDNASIAALERNENQGYLFEVWPSGNPYYWMSDIGLVGGSGGLVIYRTDGATSAVIDASPSPNISHSWGTIYDLSDIALVPGEVFDDGIVRVENVELLADGSVSFEVSLYEGG